MQLPFLLFNQWCQELFTFQELVIHNIFSTANIVWVNREKLQKPKKIDPACNIGPKKANIINALENFGIKQGCKETAHVRLGWLKYSGRQLKMEG